MKEYQKSYNGIEYNVIEIYDNESNVSEFQDKYKYCHIKKFENGHLFKQLIFKDGKLHNEFGPSIRMKRKGSWWLNNKKYFSLASDIDGISQYQNELRRIRLELLLK